VAAEAGKAGHGESIAVKRRPKLLTFKDNKGRIIKLPDNLTIEGCVKFGIVEVKLTPKGTPVPDNWFTHTPAK
jgi:hypothetical protein